MACVSRGVVTGVIQREEAWRTSGRTQRDEARDPLLAARWRAGTPTGTAGAVYLTGKYPVWTDSHDDACHGLVGVGAYGPRPVLHEGAQGWSR